MNKNADRLMIIRMAEVGGIPMDRIARVVQKTAEYVAKVCIEAREAELIGMVPPEKADDQTGAVAAELIYLRNRVEVLERENRELRGMSRSDENFVLRHDLGFTETESLLVGLLLKHVRVNRIVAYDAVYGTKSDADLPDLKTMDVYICKIRKKLMKHGVRIKTVWGDGWYMTPEYKRRLKSIIDEHRSRREREAA